MISKIFLPLKKINSTYLQTHLKSFFTNIYIKVILLITLLLLFAGWGSVGHKIINQKAPTAFPASMSYFQSWTTFLTNHASDADYRKDTDPTEAPKHYIDIEDYPEWVATGRISQSLDSVIALHGITFVTNTGTLPWTIVITVDSLTKAMRARNWDRAQQLAADLGHYVGDGHMPLHITRNYNGQYTGQTGVHSRYESSLIQKYQTEIVYTPEPAAYIPNVSDSVFQFIYLNYDYVDSILYDDSLAKAVTGSTSSTAYQALFWEKAKGFTIQLFKRASERLAALIYTAWKNAGSPDPLSFVQYFNNGIMPERLSLSAYPNPFNSTVTLSVSLANASTGDLFLYNQSGELVRTIQAGLLHSGQNLVRVQCDDLSAGIYFIQLKSGSNSAVTKILLLK
jgi:hypothetical protein